MTKREEGGKHAIKGFLFQFDKTIIEILENPNKVIYFEQEEDVFYEGYYIQIKHRENSKYYPSSIRPATKELLHLFRSYPESYFCLYCYFNDKTPQSYKPTVDELKTIVNCEVDEQLLNDFEKHFKVIFTKNYSDQFSQTLTLIKEKLCVSKELAVIYHSVIRSHLLDLSIKEKTDRKISFRELSNHVTTAQDIVAMAGYQNILEEENYLKVIKKTYFTFKGINIDNFERLFILECDERTESVDLLRLIKRIGDKYFKVKKSPQPFIILKNLEKDKIIQIKQALIDTDYFFNDGTFFDGDKVRADKLFASSIDKYYGKVKIAPIDILTSTNFKKHFHEMYDFYINSPTTIEGKASSKLVTIPIKNVSQCNKFFS